MSDRASRSERRRIDRAVKHDELLQDPDEAQRLVDVAGRLRWKRKHHRSFALLGLLVAAGGVATAVADSSRNPLWFTLPVLILLVGSEVWKYVDSRGLSERWERAEARHLEHIEHLGLPVWRFPED